MARFRFASVLTATLLLGSFGASSFVIAFGSRAQPPHPLRTVTHRTASVQPADNDARHAVTIAEKSAATGVADSASTPTAPANVPEVIAALAAWSQNAVPVAPAPTEPAYRAHLSDDKFLAGRLSLFDPATGRLIPGENVVVHFLRHGQIMSETKLGIGGVFQAAGLLPGVYSVIAVGDGGFAAFSVEVLPVVNPNQGAATAVRDVVGLQIDAALVPIQVVPLVLNVVQQGVPPFAAQLPAAAIPPVGPLVPFGRNVVPLVEPVAPLAVAGPRAPIKTPLIVRSPDGRVTGRALRLHPVSGLPMPVSGAKVLLIRNGMVAREATTDAAGLFALRDDGTSPFSVLIASVEGISVFSVGYTTREEMMPPTTPAPPPANPEAAPNAVEATGVSWSFRQEPQVPQLGTAPLEATLIPPEDLLLLQQLLPPPMPPIPPMIGAGLGGGFGGGGGGGGGGGLGLLGLAGLAGLAGLGGNDNNQPAPASPFIP